MERAGALAVLGVDQVPLRVQLLQPLDALARSSPGGRVQHRASKRIACQQIGADT